MAENRKWHNWSELEDGCEKSEMEKVKICHNLLYILILKDEVTREIAPNMAKA